MVNTQNISQTIVFNTNPEKLYALLLDEKRLSGFDNATAKMSKEVGGAFHTPFWSGINIELVPGKRIVQAWRWNNQEVGGSWPDGHYSLVFFELIPATSGTKLIFNQIGIPVSHLKLISDGWKRFHWTVIKDMLTKEKA